MSDETTPRRGHVDLITEAARDALTVRRAFGDPITHGDVTVIPVARVTGGNGVGFGSGALDARRGDAAEDSEHSTESGGHGDGGGGGFGVRVRPIGVFVINGDDAEWQPTLDVTRIALVGQAVGVVAIVATAHVIRYKIAHSAAPTRVAAPGPVAAGLVRLIPRLPRLPRPHLVRRTAIGTAHLVTALLARRR